MRDHAASGVQIHVVDFLGVPPASLSLGALLVVSCWGCWGLSKYWVDFTVDWSRWAA